MSTPESKIKRKLTEMLKRHGVWYFYPNAGAFGRAGVPDVIAIVAGQFFGIECKADCKKKPTALQRKCGGDIIKAGGWWYLVCDTETLGEVEERIQWLLSNNTRL